jgi:hypothetical protein
MEMVIYILGDIDFSYRILLGVTMLYQDSAMHLMAAVLLILFVLWSFVKWTLNPEKSPYPFKEFAFGIIFYMIFGGLEAISPTFDVRLETDVYQGQTFQARTINNVPLLAAVPAWLATNLFKGMRETLSPILVIPGTNIYPGMSQGIDPLTMLVKLNDISYQTSLDPYLEMTIKEYAKECYVPYHEAASNPSNDSILELMHQPVDQFWAKAEVNVNWMYAKAYSQANPNGIDNTCKDVFDYVTGELPGYQAKVQLNLSANNIQSTDITSSTDLIMSSLTGGSSLSPYTFMTGKFVAANFAEGLNTSDVPKMQMWAKKMMFEASQKRVFERAGESNLFSQIMIPMITAIEAFAFFIAPVLMLLTVMGGAGISYIGKYLMLTLFINMWSFIKIFTDFFMLLTVHKGINGDLTVNANYHPFSMVNQNYTFMELENYLAIASSLTSAIPLFAMFLLYGGVHSMMGVMRGMQGGSVDSSNLAPTMATPMTAGRTQAADLQWSHIASTENGVIGHQSPTSALYGSQTVQDSISGATTRESGQAATQLTAASNALMTSVGKAFTVNDGGGTTTTSGDTEVTTASAGRQKTNQLAEAVNAKYGEGSSDSASDVGRFAAALALQLKAGGGSSAKLEQMGPAEKKEHLGKAATKVGKALGFGGDISALFASQYSEENREGFEKAITNSLAYMESDTGSDTYTRGVNWGKMDSTSLTAAEQDAAQNITSNAQTYTEQSAHYQQTKDMIGQTGAIGQTKTLDWTVASGTINNQGGLNKVMSMIHGLGTDAQNSILSRHGHDPSQNTPAENRSALTDVVMQSYKDNAFEPTKALMSMASDMTAMENYGAASSIYKAVAPLAGDYRGGFMAAAEQNDNLAKIDQRTKDAADHLVQNDTSKDVEKPTDLSKVTQKAQDITGNSGTANKDNKDRLRSQATSLDLIDAQGKPTKPFNDLATDLGLRDPERAKELVAGMQESSTELQARGNKLDDAGALKAGVAGIGAVMGGIEDVTKLIQGPDQAWGKDAEQWAGTATAIAANAGLSSGSLYEGLHNLYSYGADDFKKLETAAKSGDVEALQTLSAMNDAALLVTNSGDLGKQLTNAMPDDQAGRVMLAVAKTEDLVGNKEGIGGVSTNEFNSISAARLSGEITDTQADAFVGLASDNAPRYKSVPDDLQSVAYSAAFGNVANNPALLDIVDGAKGQFIEPSSGSDGYSHNYPKSTFGELVSDLKSTGEGTNGRSPELAEYYNANTIDNITDTSGDLMRAKSLQYDNENIAQGVNVATLDLANSPKVLGSYFEAITQRESNGEYSNNLQELNSNIVGLAQKDPESIIGSGNGSSWLDVSPIISGVVSAYNEVTKDSDIGDRFSAISAVSPGFTQNMSPGQWQQNATSLAFLASSFQTQETQDIVNGMQGEEGQRIRDGLDNLSTQAFSGGVLIDNGYMKALQNEERPGAPSIFPKTNSEPVSLDQPVDKKG